MAAARRFKAGPRAVLAGDGALVMAAAFAVCAPLGSLLQVVGGFFMVLVVLSPLLAWWLHGRHVGGMATGGAAIGYLAGAACLVVLFGLIVLFIALPFYALGRTGPDWILPAVIAAAYLAVAARLGVDALRDLSAKPRQHVRLDVARLVATTAGVAYMVGAIVWAAGHPQWDYVGAFLLFAACGVVGAAVVTVADWMVRRAEQRGPGHLISGV